jgi:ribonucleoside-diphosphate reductase alpha chain
MRNVQPANASVASEKTEFALKKRGLRFERYFTKPGIHPFDEIEWELRTATISNEKGEKIFEQKDVEIPKSWSMTATNVVVSKYFYGPMGTPQRETSVRQLVDRIAKTYYQWGLKDGYFASNEDAENFYNELLYLLVNQYMSFNSPVWFNVGVEEKPQCSACFINSVQDSMESILNLAKTEGMLFKYGSGTGSNLSTLRSSKEKLTGGGTPSGPVSFMKGYDAFAGVIKSGGKTRRAAKMVILNVDHPDIVKFINCKAEEEKKAWALIEAGYDGGFNVPGGAYDSVFYQNANHSVRVTDEFMKAVLEDREVWTKAVKGGQPIEKLRARDIMKQIAEAAWICGDPGIQFDTTINNWHTCAATAPIHSSKPCSENMFLDDTACNLASLNLMKFRTPNGDLDVESFKKAVQITITAMEISVDNSSYPTPAIAHNRHEFRPLGLGYANLGALLMARGVAYDSVEGRTLAAAITSLM